MKRILVIGGGVAGLTAARELAQSGARVTLLEARSRLGGRIHTEYPRGAGGPVELGAEFLHGRHPELWRMARAAGLLVYEVRGEHRYARPGRLEAGEGIWDRTGQILSRMARAGGPDRTFAEFIHGEFAGPRWKEAREWAINYVEGFNAADHERVSIQWLAQGGRASGEIEGDRQFRAANGYSRLIDWLVGECERLGVIIVPGSAVRRIVWRRGSLSASTNSDPGPAPRFDAAIVTVPLGVLQ
ncbi:MAG: FAD-dependent oxidoreductase, partial [Acidobacteriia bacterium]|nr:FAD-dependent oxidoreductase [Terriglobia bacterium]